MSAPTLIELLVLTLHTLGLPSSLHAPPSLGQVLLRAAQALIARPSLVGLARLLLSNEALETTGAPAREHAAQALCRVADILDAAEHWLDRPGWTLYAALLGGCKSLGIDRDLARVLVADELLGLTGERAAAELGRVRAEVREALGPPASGRRLARAVRA